jgi:monofunctional biosynthetic peptidoglycan transglycosylase
MKIASKTLKLILILITFSGLTTLLVIVWAFSQFPSKEQIRGCMTTSMFKVRLCSTNQDYVHLNDVSPYILKIIVLTEDSGFWQHRGFDMGEIEKSLKKNIESGKYLRGGSTITQQLSKNLFLTKEKSLLRKVKEAIITVQIEKTLSKKEILEKYINVVQLGTDIYGIKRATSFYFNKEPRDLKLVEAAFIAMLLPSPEKYNRSFFKKELTPFAEKRLNQIIDVLFQYQKISETEYLGAKADLSIFLRGTPEEQMPTTDVPEETVTEED